MAELIRYEQVDISYKGQRIVHNINFSLDEGEIMGIVGESGSGKSSLLRAALNLLGRDGLVTRGDIYYKGQDLPDLSQEEMRRISGSEIGMIFQHAGGSFCPIRRVGEQLQEMMEAHGSPDKQENEQQACELLARFGFDSPQRIMDSYPFELSGGMQQRAAVAAAMLLRPKLLLADEPTSALDVTVQKQVIEEMLLAREVFGTAIILVTHNMGVVKAMADKMLVMHQGEAVEQGMASYIMKSPSSPYTKKLLAAMPRLRR